MKMETTLAQKIKSTFEHSGIYGLGSLIKGLSALILLPLYTNYLSVEQFGKWGLLFATAQIMRIILGLGLVQAVFRSYYDYTDEKDRRDVVFTAVQMQFISSVVFLALVIPFSAKLSMLILSGIEYQHFIILVAVYAVVFGFHRIALGIFRARGDPFQYILFEGIGFFTHLGLAFVLIVLYQLELAGALWSLLAGSVITTGLSYFYTWRHIQGRFSGFEAKKMLAYGLPTIATVFSIILIKVCDRYLIKLFMDFTRVGLYELGCNFGMILLLFFATPIRLVWEPMYLSVKDKPNAREFYSRIFTYTVLAGTVLFLLVSFFSRDVIRLIAKESFYGAYRVVPLVALGYLFFGLERIVSIGIGLSRRTYVASIVFVLGAALNIVLNILWIPVGGIMAAASALLVTAIVVFIGIYVSSQKYYKVSYEWGRITKLALAGTMVYITSWGLFPGHGVFHVISKLAVLLSFPVLLLLFGFFTPGEKRGLLQFIRHGINFKR